MSWHISEEILGDHFYIFSKKYTELCPALPTHFDCIFLSSQPISEDVFSEDEWLDFLFFGLKEAK